LSLVLCSSFFDFCQKGVWGLGPQSRQIENLPSCFK
jgi:hypothetical protein